MSRCLPVGKRFERARRCPRLWPWIALAGPVPPWFCRCVGEAKHIVVNVDVVALVVKRCWASAAIVPSEYIVFEVVMSSLTYVAGDESTIEARMV